MQYTGAMIVVDSKAWKKLHGHYHIFFAAVVQFNDATFLMPHIECDGLPLAKAGEIALWPDCDLMKSEGKRKDKVHCTLYCRLVY